MRISAFCFLALTGLTILGTASSLSAGESQEPEACLFLSSIYNWKTVDKQRLLVWSPDPNHPFQVTLAAPCHDLDFAETVAFASRDNRLCGHGGDAVLVKHRRCAISSIRAISVERVEQILLDTR